MSFGKLLLEHQKQLDASSPVPPKEAAINVSGKNLSLADVVRISRCQAKCALDASALSNAAKSEALVKESLGKQHVIYGVNTGVGGSANTRTEAVEELQRLLMRKLHYGIMTEPSRSHSTRISTPAMPEDWARAAVLIRLNSLISGSSGVQKHTIETLQKILEHDIVPRIPLRGSISASGDLSPLSYICGTIQGKSTLSVTYGDATSNVRRIVSARHALKSAGIEPVLLKAKEGLAIANGTAVSCAVGALALNETLFLYALSQILTAMSVEALNGTDESFDPYFAKVRPHAGQKEAAEIVNAAMRGSKLVNTFEYMDDQALRQDRYSIRTAAQWTGPLAEDLELAYSQILTEINSATDNPLIDPDTSRILHGGNFQAKSVTSACEKMRLALQSLGRMLFSQCTEVLNPATNNGLPPNLVADEPSESYIWKGTDMMVAALVSELGFLANPVGSHVQSAEMGNQSINSLALISARYTYEAVDCLTQLVAVHLIALCQALDLRVMFAKFVEEFEVTFKETAFEFLAMPLKSINTAERDSVIRSWWKQFLKQLEFSTTMDSSKRFLHCAECVQPAVLKSVALDGESLAKLRYWTSACSERARDCYLKHVELTTQHADAAPYLGHGTRQMYDFVRKQLKVPFIREQSIRTPDPEAEFEPGMDDGADGGLVGMKIGEYNTRVHDSIKDGLMYPVIASILAGATGGQENGSKEHVKGQVNGRVAET